VLSKVANQQCMTTTTESADLLLVEEVAREMRTTVWAVRYWIRTGKLHALRPGKRLLVRRSDMHEMLSAMAVRPSQAAAGARTP
jgi:excisionase family DNA binding protein